MLDVLAIWLRLDPLLAIDCVGFSGIQLNMEAALCRSSISLGSFMDSREDDSLIVWDYMLWRVVHNIWLLLDVA